MVGGLQLFNHWSAVFDVVGFDLVVVKNEIDQLFGVVLARGEVAGADVVAAVGRET